MLEIEDCPWHQGTAYYCVVNFNIQFKLFTGQEKNYEFLNINK